MCGTCPTNTRCLPCRGRGRSSGSGSRRAPRSPWGWGRRTGPCRYLLVVNAANRGSDFDWVAGHERRGSDVRDVSDEYALLAVQGPRALERLGLEAGPAFTWEMGAIDGIEVMVNRTGYTG